MELFKPKRLCSAISLAIFSTTGQSATFNVTELLDDGTGLVSNTLSWAILQANTTPGDDVIELNTNVSITGVMKRLVDSNVIIQSDANRRAISGGLQFRPLFIKSGQVEIRSIDITQGSAEGGASSRGGRGAGMGGAIFQYSGQLILSDVSVSNSRARGGVNTLARRGGGGLFGDGTTVGGGGGLFADGLFASGGYGGYGNYQTSDPRFGQGGSYAGTIEQAHGGFGAGGAYGYDSDGGAGGFGGGGGYSYNYVSSASGGLGGFGAGGGDDYYSSQNGAPGFGGSGQRAAGFGGGVFIRSGMLRIENSSFTGNLAQATSDAKGYGGGLFVVHTTENSNGNNRGMPGHLADVFVCGSSFASNMADSDLGQASNNDDFFDLANRIQATTGGSIGDPCGSGQEINLTGNGMSIVSGDNSPSVDDGTILADALVQSTPSIQTFEIQNTGADVLFLNEAQPIQIFNDAGSHFSVIRSSEQAYIGIGDTLGFDVVFTPASIGLHEATVQVMSNDTDEPVYEFVVQATGVSQPEMAVIGNGVVIVDGDDMPDPDDHTLFVPVIADGSSATRIFTVDNSADGVLELTGSPVVEIQGSSEFDVTLMPPGSVGSNSTVNFEITYTPVDEGLDQAVVVIDNNDADENPYDFVIQGFGISPAPEIQVLGTTVIQDGDNTPSSDDGTYLGAAQESGQSVSRSFSIQNGGINDLELTGNPIVELQNNSGQFAITSQPATTTVSGSGGVSFDVTFTPVSIGVDNATVVIASNDPDVPEFDFVIEAEGLEQAGVAEVRGLGVVIENGDTTPTSLDGTDFGRTAVTGGLVTRNFDVTNTGLVALPLGSVVISSPNPDFIVSTQPPVMQLAPGESTEFEVSFDPTLGGNRAESSVQLLNQSDGVVHGFMVEGYGQPTLTINALNNYLQEGETMTFEVSSDAVSPNGVLYSWALINGIVNGDDFVGGLPSGSGVLFNNDQFSITTRQDGIAEGVEWFSVGLQDSVSASYLVGFPSFYGGVIDDDWIFDDGFEATTLNQLAQAIMKYHVSDAQVPICVPMRCEFLGQELLLETEFEWVEVLNWFEEQLVLFRPDEDWDGDGLANHHDLNPFGLHQTLLERIISDQ